MSTKRSSDGLNADTPQKKLRCSIDGGPTVTSRPITVLVGKTEEEFFVHQKLLRSSSTFFENTLSKDWKEKEERTVRLPEVKVGTFDIYIKWLYTGRFYAVKDDDLTLDEDSGFGTDAEQDRWTDCYPLGDFLQDDGFKDAMIDVLIERMIDENVLPHVGLAEHIYSHSTADSPHRKLAVDTVVHFWPKKDLTAKYLCQESHLVEYLNDLIVAMAKHLRGGTKEQPIAKFFRDRGPCVYHEHTRLNKPCYKTMPGFKC